MPPVSIVVRYSLVLLRGHQQLEPAAAPPAQRLRVMAGKQTGAVLMLDPHREAGEAAVVIMDLLEEIPRWGRGRGEKEAKHERQQHFSLLGRDRIPRLVTGAARPGCGRAFLK